MRMHAFHRTELLLGQEGYARVASASVCVVGLGGVGSFAAEAMARSGVRHLTLVDFDRVCLTNVNRQLVATRKTVGRSKAELVAERVRQIHPGCDVRELPVFYSEDTREQVLDRPYDLVIDAIDNMATKLDLLQTCRERGLAVFSAMGAGGRLDPTRIRVGDLMDTDVDPFARIVRKQLRRRGVTDGIVAVWSDEPPHALDEEVQAGFTCICPDKANSPNQCDKRFQVQGTVSWMPSIFGLALAGAATAWLAGEPLPNGTPSTDPLKSPQGKASATPAREPSGLDLSGLQPVSRASRA